MTLAPLVSLLRKNMNMLKRNQFFDVAALMMIVETVDDVGLG